MRPSLDVGRIALNVRVKPGNGPSDAVLPWHHPQIQVRSRRWRCGLPIRFNTIAVDQRGHGLSDKPESGYEASDFAEDIAADHQETRSRPRHPRLVTSLGSRNSVTADCQIFGTVCAPSWRSISRPISRPKSLTALESRVNAAINCFNGSADCGGLSRGPLPPTFRRQPSGIRAETGYCEVEGGLRPLASGSAMAQIAAGLRADLKPAYPEVTRPVALDARRGEQARFRRGAGEDQHPAARSAGRRRPGADHYVNEVSPEITFKAITNFIDA